MAGKWPDAAAYGLGEGLSRRARGHRFNLVNSFLTPALYGIGVLLVAAVILQTVYRYAGRRAGDPETGRPDARRTAPADQVVRVSSPAGHPEDSGRHHVPEEFLRVATIRLSADRIARAKVPPPGVLNWSAPDDDVRL